MTVVLISSEAMSLYFDKADHMSLALGSTKGHPDKLISDQSSLLDLLHSLFNKSALRLASVGDGIKLIPPVCLCVCPPVRMYRKFSIKGAILTRGSVNIGIDVD